MTCRPSSASRSTQPLCTHVSSKDVPKPWTRTTGALMGGSLPQAAVGYDVSAVVAAVGPELGDGYVDGQPDDGGQAARVQPAGLVRPVQPRDRSREGLGKRV